MKYGRSDLVRMGLFSEAQYVSSGETYNSKKNSSSLDYRSKGKQFLTAPPKRGHDVKDSYFDKEFIRLFENEPYTDLVVLRRRWRLQAKEKNITNVPFKPSSVPPKPSGKGSHWGTIEQQWPLDTKGTDMSLMRKIKDDIKKQHEPRNFLTAPPKQGSGYGYPNVTIGKPYQYESDPFDRREALARTERSENKKKMVGERPFISSSTNHEYFNPFAGLSVPKDEKGGEGAAPQAGATKKAFLPTIPFKPTSCCGTTINPYPSYEPPKGGDDKAAAKTAAPAGPRRDMIFKPSGMTGSYPIRSIIEVSCPLAPPKWIQDSLTAAVVAADI
eukprot:jgi/Hompol1/6066/HPOL_004861-RA